VVPAVFETGTQGDEHLLDGLPQVEHASAGAALIDSHLLEVADQFGGAGGIAFEQVKRFATSAEQGVDLGAVQAAAGNGLRELAKLFAEDAGDDARVAERCVQFVRHAGNQVAERSELFRLQQLRHRLAQLVGALGDQFLEVFAIAS